MSVDDYSLIECCLIFVVPEFFNSLSQERKSAYHSSSPALRRPAPRVSSRSSEKASQAYSLAIAVGGGAVTLTVALGGLFVAGRALVVIGEREAELQVDRLDDLGGDVLIGEPGEVCHGIGLRHAAFDGQRAAFDGLVLRRASEEG